MTRMILLVALLGVTLVLGACSSGSTTTAEVTRSSGSAVTAAPAKSGPPPHAPAHGYRAKQGGVDLVYDGTRSLYVVSGSTDTYYAAGIFYRKEYGTWNMSSEMNGPWKVVRKGKLPAGLDYTTPKKDKKHTARTTAN